MTENDHLPLSAFTADMRSAHYADEMRTSWATAILARPLGVMLAWLCARIGLAPMSVTMIALVLALSLPLQALVLPIGWVGIAVCISGLIYQILDCTDGTLARATGQTSEHGADLDFLIDMGQWGLLFLAIGIVADRTLDGAGLWTGVAMCGAWARLMARVVRDRLHSDAANNAGFAAFRLAQLPQVAIAGMSGVLPLFALTGGWLGIAVIVLLIYGILDMVEGLLPILRRS